jgi:phospholipid/cholesterol/gamma-HCH transport system ATP-binding protein
MPSPTTDVRPEAARDEAHIALESVRMAFGARVVFDHLSCRFPRGKISVVLGGSGSGKSTALRLIGGLVHPQAGRILVEGEDITRLSERQLYRVRRKLGMMFQGGALLDSMTVFDNLAFPLQEHSRLSAGEIAAQVHAHLEAVGLTNVDDLLPGQLSGGMMKRVALARALMMDPTIVLCDEALSGLDPISTRRVESLLMTINRQRGMTIVLVSHHIPSTMRMADHVLLLLPDETVEGTPEELRQSANPRVAAFLSEDVDEATALAEGEVERLPIAGGSSR